MTQTAILKERPWRFNPGDVAYVAGWPVDATVLITAATAGGDYGFPHYLAVDNDGNEWKLPQIHLSKTPLNQL